MEDVVVFMGMLFISFHQLVVTTYIHGLFYGLLI